jgi:hypothetical protein
MTPEELKAALKEQEKLTSLIEMNSKSMGTFATAINDAGRLTRLLNVQLKQVNEQTQKINNNKVKIDDLKEEIRIGRANKTLTIADFKLHKEKIRSLQKESQEIENQIILHNEVIAKYQRQISLLKQSLSSWKAIGNVISNEIGSALKNGWKSLMDQDKAVRKTQLSMGVLSNQSLSFSQNMYKTAIQTSLIGANAKELAKYQQDYSEQIGRTVVLSQDGLIAMAEMAKGTMLGADGAAQLAAEMDAFGISTTSARDIVQETVDSAHKMGVNSEATTKKLLSNLKTAQKYNFKGGVKGITDMTIQGQKFKISMEAVAGFADKLFTPEGAIDAAAQLQVLGGAWSQIADPFQLMYQARNDMAGLQKSMIEATAGAAQFNKETGKFEISGLELHRLRQAAEVTGQDFGDLAEQARQLARVKDIKTKIAFKFDKDTEEFITSTANYSKEKAGYTINIDGQDTLIKDLSRANIEQLKTLALQKEDLAKRAMQSQTFDETWENLKNMFKATLLPALDGFSTAMKKVLGNPAVVKGLTDFAVSIGNLSGIVGEFIANNPWTAAITYGIFKASQWVLNGIALGMGFNTVAGGNGKGGIISGISNLLGGGSGPSQFGSSIYQRSGSMYNKSTGAYMGDGISAGIGQKGVGKMGTGLTTAGIIGIGGLVATGIGMGLRAWAGDKKTTGASAARVGGKALEYGGTGAMLGAMVGGPLGGAIGGGVGALAGAGVGMYEESQMQDYVMRPGQKAQPFSSNDTLIGFKPGGPIEKQSSISNSAPQSMQITFAPLKIDFGIITLQSGNSNTKIDLANDPILARELSSVIQQELRKAIGGGVLNPNAIGNK